MNEHILGEDKWCNREQNLMKRNVWNMMHVIGGHDE